MTLASLGDSAVVLTVGEGLDEVLLRRVRAIAAALEHDPPAGVVDVVAAFGAITVYYDLPLIGEFARFCADIEQRSARAEATPPSGAARVVEIPVCYGGEFGPDLGEVAAKSCRDSGRVVALHAGGSYVVQAIGFAPGFGYLGGLDARICTPRRATPRTHVPGGSVGIGGVLTAVYPFATPGGWNIIGRTPLRIFDATRAEPAILRAGDRVKFRAITPEEFFAWT